VSRKRAAVALIVIGLVVFAAMQLNSHVRVSGESRMASYRQIDADTIAITVSVSPYGWTRLTGVTETATDVRVSIESFVLQLGAGTAQQMRVELPVTLVQDLGERVVMDDIGAPVPKR
jgi:hypothetical protein